MFSRILDLQRNEYGPHDRRCYVTTDKINMVQLKGIQYEEAIEELGKTFTMPKASVPTNAPKGPHNNPPRPLDAQTRKQTKQKSKVMKVLNSMRKKKP
jgi:hypothetical protein